MKFQQLLNCISENKIELHFTPRLDGDGVVITARKRLPDKIVSQDYWFLPETFESANHFLDMMIQNVLETERKLINQSP